MRQVEPIRRVQFETADDTVTSRFRTIVAKYGDKTALRFQGRTMTYSELDRASNVLARRIFAACGPGQHRVAFFLETGMAQIVTLLGILKAGKTYVPLDVSFPSDRNQFMIQDAQCSLVITNTLNLSQAKVLAGKRPVLNSDEEDHESDEDPSLKILPEDIFMIIYTSGSTGTPKGVVHNHRNMVHFARRFSAMAEITADDVFAFYFSICFSAHGMPILGALMNGCTLSIFDLKKEEFSRFGQWLNEEAITITLMIPSVLRQFLATLEKGDMMKKMRVLLIGGETLYRSDIEKAWQHLRKTATIFNIYASTEGYLGRGYRVQPTTIIKGNVIPIGYAVEDVEMLITDEDGTEKGPNKIGEIRIRSPYLALGYWNLDGMTAHDFLQDSLDPTVRVFRSSDMGYSLPDGCIVHVGRSDSMVKLRGYRIDLGEIENLMIQNEDVREAVVVLKESPTGTKHIVAYVVPAGDRPPDVNYLRIAVLRMLPSYMVPSYFVVLDHLPKNPIGKAIKKDLPDPEWGKRGSQEDIVQPQTPRQEELKEVFERILEVAPIGIKDNILELGADSLRLFVAFAEIERRTGIKLNIDAVMLRPTIEHLAAILDEGA